MVTFCFLICEGFVFVVVVVVVIVVAVVVRWWVGLLAGCRERWDRGRWYLGRKERRSN